MVKFEVRFLEPAKDFLEGLDPKSREKVLLNIWRSRESNDPSLFKKLSADIWEFRSRYGSKQFRLLAFWDKAESIETLVIATHGFVKKSQKIPQKEILKAEKLMEEYLDNKYGL